MKIVGKFMAALFVAILFTNCSTDDNAGGDTSADLVGIWNMQSFEYEGETSTELLGVPFNIDFVGEAINIDAFVEFTESPNEFTSSGSYDIELTSSVEADGMTTSDTVTESIDDFASSGTWSRDGNTLSFDGGLVDTGSGGVMTGMDLDMSNATIVELTETTLRLSQEESEEITQDGQTISFSFSSEIVFTRQ